jgi:outer membrane protein assembly factor BamE (lipoprotein component of BamABCDE complex)
MRHSGLILILAASIFSTGCRTYSPEVRAMWHKYRLVKPGMTASEVYAIEPTPSVTFPPPEGTQVASWFLGPVWQDHVEMAVYFGEDGRVEHIYRYIKHGWGVNGGEQHWP